MMRGCTHAEARENTVNAGTANALRRRCAAAPAGARGGGPGNARGAAAAGEGGGTLKPCGRGCVSMRVPRDARNDHHLCVRSLLELYVLLRFDAMKQ
jgi:hypothetical protein